MKKITRMLIFSALALYLTSLWNQGFKVNFTPYIFIRTILLIALFYYLVLPISKIILLPVNFITLGLLSSLIYFILFYVFISHFSLVEIKAWKFLGLTFGGLVVKPVEINYITNVFLSSFSLSLIINILELIL
ncbi:hypothetical protein A3C98_03810 [Candidatus Roizmanbacteria bacterium RIFCSPHIGHO2_02_FULL_37_15]|uniref:Uncharacterized protein n=1 Tax=Candidatus Roizmanbacteria bacterium RIFCSPLOWO2_01_FULL_37_16 TaxID=1802058 RepID=A0A1F7IKN1_9BACT|nr:MAG: hypothetical protein A2859_04925 [Candidatus Roizmanbacteria bacterium RIFCSPHIGHO2_01_FULL_37_16b]OGK21995.1 MAG: hypothetical protein A3C98_03810 [Candidatus Roizmanbacteria bacterium RIFCSPHIGHO2_02_FULL_37_15]OGK31756.1 MAG: hypothetical protein A3F57_00215 [Candidatus Roizmanbacteria bacterium RIFCSPHIGHO2_12_FULL_36_11]OGK43916.1 MAG: hypothetical protein A3B40_03850 [Candidatus Roizmanbacteria bacterium RIFCSPLOWO2_01_FULL_37_16]OGK56353.1 MAG: hypothetical protein A3I50_03475 [C